jgi:hypothetical protein
VLIREYHDREWGVPAHDDRTHFEFLILEAAQAGLSWSIVLNRRDGYRRALRQALGRVSGANGAAAILGMPRQTLESKLKKLGIRPYHFRVS